MCAYWYLENIISSELPNFSQPRICSAFSFAFFLVCLFKHTAHRPWNFRMVLRKRDGNGWCWCLMQAELLWTDCTFLCLASAIAFFLPLHISTSLPNRATFCRSACVFGVIAILLRPTHAHTTISRQSFTYRMSHSRVRENVVQKEDENRCFWVHGEWRDNFMMMDWNLLAIEWFRTEKVLNLDEVSSEVWIAFSTFCWTPCDNSSPLLNPHLNDSFTSWPGVWWCR